AALQDAAHDGDGVVGGGRVAGAVGEEHAVGRGGVDLVQAGGGGQDVHLDAALGHALRRHALDAQVDGGHGEPLGAERGDDVGLRRSDLGGQVGAGHLRGGADPGQQGGLVGEGVAGEDAAPHGAALPQVAGEGAGVDAADADDALGGQFRIEGAAGAPAGRDAGGVAHDV